jgi:hypothetical protein
MLILEQESPESLVIILRDEEAELLHSSLFTELMRDHEESLSRANHDLDDWMTKMRSGILEKMTEV